MKPWRPKHRPVTAGPAGCRRWGTLTWYAPPVRVALGLAAEAFWASSCVVLDASSWTFTSLMWLQLLHGKC